MNLIVFDFDGTIADSFEIFIEATNCLSEDFGYSKLSSSQIARCRQLSLRSMVQELDIQILVNAVKSAREDHIVLEFYGNLFANKSFEEAEENLRTRDASDKC